MNSQRRNLIKTLGAVAVVSSIPRVSKGATVENSFHQDDTAEQRLHKFNNLTGLSLTFGAHWRTGHSTFGERCLMDGDKHFTGPMNEETFMHWSAQVALGYRIAKAQG